MITNSNYTHLKDKSFSSNDQELLLGGGSLSNDKIKSCKICPADGFPHEPIIFRKITTTETSSNDQKEIWTTEAMVDEFFLCLVRVQQVIINKENGKQLTVRKYYLQARELMRWIPIAKPSPAFIIYISDLTPEIKNEIVTINSKDTLTYILKQAVGRLFENLDFEYYHLSIARKLRVRLEK